MRLEQLPHGQIEQLRLVPSGPLAAAFTPGAEARLQLSTREPTPLLGVGAEVVAVTGEGRKNAVVLADLCTRNFPRIAWIVEVAPCRVVVQVHTFLHALPLPQIDLGVDEKLLETLARINPRMRSAAGAIEWLNDQFLLPEAGAGSVVRAFASTDVGPAAGAFTLYGRSSRAFVRRVSQPDQTEILIVDKVARSAARGAGQPLAVMTGAVRFVDATVSAKLRSLQVETAAELSFLAKAGSSFLDAWSRYGEVENEQTLDRARRAGWLAYDHVEALSGHAFRFALAAEVTPEAVKRFRTTVGGESGQGIESSAVVPEVVKREMPWDEYRMLPRAPRDAGSAVTFHAGGRWNPRENTVELTRSSGDEASPPDQGVLFVSLDGDRTRLMRREAAEQAIREARCPMPQLRLLLEDLPVPVARRGTLAPLSPSVKRKVFGDHGPTPKQEEALSVALNTPDIALIQGPPGTGKTTIIVALVERLQQVWDTSDGVQGRLLLSGFQHDAVTNAVQRMRVNGLPPIKFTGRRNRLDDTDSLDATLDRWSSERAAAIRAHLPPRPASALRDSVVAAIEGYLLAPGTLEQSAGLLSQTAEALQSAISTGLLDRMHALARELRKRARELRESDPERDRLVHHVRSLRDDPVAFLDDGNRNAYRLADELERQGHQTVETQKLLGAAADWSGPGAPPFLGALRELRRRLLLLLLPADHTRETVPQTRTDVLDLLAAARDELDRAHRGSGDAADDAALAFLNALECDPEAVKRAVVTYTSVFAATCQQSARRELAEQKGSTGYDTVVVDEAARATPLDLFIPLAQASRRIVLVGDHRQLPHILDRELERELESVLASSSTSSAAQRTSELLNTSLFERLFKDLRAREKRDGIRRTVTLDEQYRMHPILGDFVSAQFYAPHGIDEAFRSPRPALDFAHTLPGYEGPAAWLDLPRSRGAELSRRSKSREVEASVIVAEVKRLMDSEGGKKLTFGVISFYSDQVALLTQKFEDEGMLSSSDDDVPERTRQYCELRLDDGRTAERLRCGTVDAFQGMEFDVVFLSTVRSNALADQTEHERRRKYGHLMLPNRLCVAMSRQKRLLVVVGDPAMLRAPNAATAIGPLVQFRGLGEVRDAPGV